MYAVLHLDHFPLQALLRTEPALRGCAVGVLDEAARGAVIANATPQALAAGVELGQSVPRAQARCPSLVIRTRRPDREDEATAALLAAAFSVTSQVEHTSAGVATMDLSTLAPLRRIPALPLALRELESLGLHASGGFGATPLLALYAARQAAPGNVLEGNRELLSPLPIAVADPSPEQAHILTSWGIRTLGGLTRLPKADITHRLGRDGLGLWERAAGEVARPLNVMAPRREFSATLDCEQALETLEPLLFVLRRFVDRLALELRNAHLAALGLELTLKLADESHHTHSIRLPEAVTDAELLFRALHTYLETVRTTAAIEGVRLRAEPGRAGVRQQGLFDGGLRDPQGFADTLARVMALVGADRVGQPVCANTHRPDTFKLLPPAAALPELPQGFAHPARGLPLRRHRPPTPATIELDDVRPAFVWTPQIQGAVCRVAGPWRASGDWWQSDQRWEREEWDVELSPGGIYRLLHTPAGWFIDGEYD